MPTYPLDVLDAETQGMIGYLVEQELGNRLPMDKPVATLLTMIQVDEHDPAFDEPTKPIGPIYDQAAAEELTRARGWTFKPDGDAFRRVVPSPEPRRIFELRQIEWLLERGCVVICAGGGGIPTTYRPGRQLVGVEAVIDKDRASGLLATGVRAGRWSWRPTPTPSTSAGAPPPSERSPAATPRPSSTTAPSSPPARCCPRSRRPAASPPPGRAAIGSLADVAGMIDGTAGTVVTFEAEGIEFHP